MNKYSDRIEAGQILADELQSYANRKDVVVLALPRGGVPVGYELAKRLNLPLDIFIVRKLGVPGHEELAMGALAMGDVTLFNDEIIQNLGISEASIHQVIQQEKEELQRREIKYRHGRPFPDLHGKVILLVDDGIATGATMKVAIKALRQFQPISIVVAVPVAELYTCKTMENIADRVICPMRPESFYAVGLWYESFDQTSDEEVEALLKEFEK